MANDEVSWEQVAKHWQAQADRETHLPRKQLLQLEADEALRRGRLAKSNPEGVNQYSGGGGSSKGGKGGRSGPPKMGDSKPNMGGQGKLSEAEQQRAADAKASAKDAKDEKARQENAKADARAASYGNMARDRYASQPKGSAKGTPAPWDKK